MKELGKLKKKSYNLTCALCDEPSKMGFGNICVPFKCFLCSMCKASVQAFSFRVKEFTMSTFNEAEVEGLRTENGGGNQVRAGVPGSAVLERRVLVNAELTLVLISPSLMNTARRCSARRTLPSSRLALASPPAAAA